MKIGTILSVFGAAAVAMAMIAAAPARAAVVAPLGYTFDKATGSGTYVYDDSTGRELIDGVLGNAGWATPYQPWVGWRGQGTINIDFTFGATVQVDRIDVGSTQDNTGDVVLPSVAIFSSLDGLSWTFVDDLIIPASSANDVPQTTAPHRFLTLNNLGINAPFVRVQLQDNGPFTFADEVRFSAGAIPEPSAWLMMLVGFFGLGAMLRAGREGIAAD